MTFVLSINFVEESCYKCGLPFAMTEDFKEERLKDRGEFFCPKGHGQIYTGKSEAEKLREQLRWETLEREAVEAQLKRQKNYTKEVEKSKYALKGVITKTKNRIAKGVCPCCNRQFKDMMKHMESKHPDYAGTP